MNIFRDQELRTQNLTMKSEFEIPNAASNLHIIADFSRRTISIKMNLDAPKDRKLPQACVTWLTRQISDLKDENINIRCNWPRGIYEMDKLSRVLEDPMIIIPKGMKELPRTIEVIEIVDMAGKFRSTKVFVTETTDLVINYYKKIGQNLRRWNPKPLKVKKQELENKQLSSSDEINPFWIPPTTNRN